MGALEILFIINIVVVVVVVVVINKQADKLITYRLDWVRGQPGLDKMEECLGVNGRQLFARVDCNLEE